MTRFHDKVGYRLPDGLVDGVAQVNIVERVYTGDVLETMSSTPEGDKVNPDIRLQDRVSFLADAYALENFSKIVFVLRGDVPWIAQSVRVERPRLIVSLGGVYHDPRAPAPEEP